MMSGQQIEYYKCSVHIELFHLIWRRDTIVYVGDDDP